MIYKMMKREEQFPLLMRTACSKAHTLLILVLTHTCKCSQTTHIHTHTHTQTTLLVRSLRTGAHIFVWGADLWIVDQNHMKIYKTRRESLPCDYWRKVCRWERDRNNSTARHTPSVHVVLSRFLWLNSFHFWPQCTYFSSHPPKITLHTYGDTRTYTLQKLKK